MKTAHYGMSTFESALAVALIVAAGFTGTEVPRLGQPIAQDDPALLALDVFVDGRGLPAGSGRPHQGRVLYEHHCAACHGPEGTGATADHLTGDFVPLNDAWPDKHIGTYWPYATTLFDFIRRAMPMSAPGSLDMDEVYAITAYLLHINRIIDIDEEMNADTLPKVMMPNRNGFIRVHPEALPITGPQP